MKLTFLSAAVPLTKTISFSNRDDTYTVASYPMVSKVTSHEFEAANMREFARLVEEQGRLGRCLLKGNLDRPLNDESRATHSQEEDHEWVCFDFDKVDCKPDFEGAVVAIGKYLPECTHDCEAVIQLSASCFHPEARKLSCHVFMRLTHPVSTRDLLDWLTSINFRPNALPELRLTDSANALSLPIDRTVSSPAKLLYIAPPRLIGFKGETDGVRFLSGRDKSFVLPKFDRIDKALEYDHVNKLRENLGLDKREFSFRTIRGQDFLIKPDESQIHGVRASGDGYIRFNLNGGDSLAYFINLKEPNVIGNFKGEPYMHTSDVDEAFYKALSKAKSVMPSKPRVGDGIDVLAFYATNQGSALFVGTYDRAKDILRVDKSSETAAYSWLKEFGVPIKQSFPHYDLLYNIQSNDRYEEGYPVINMYARTEFIKKYGEAPRTQALDFEQLDTRLAKNAPVIHKILRSVTGDEDSFVRFINWLAYIFQTRQKSTTAWVLWGRQGTGKGQMMTHIIKPLLGAGHVGQILMNAIDSNFNSMLEGKMMMNIDEAALTQSRDKIETMSKLKNWTTDATIFINTKMIVAREVESFINFIVTSNDTRPIIIDQDDRRFHVGSRQTERLQFTPNEMAQLVQGEQLPAFAQLLGELIVDEFAVRNPVWNAAKQQLFESTHALPERIAMAIYEGDTGFFYDARPSDTQLAIGKTMLPITEYDALLRAMDDRTLTTLKREDLYVLFKVVVNDDRFFPDNVTQQRAMFQRLGLIPNPNETNYDKRTGKTVHGIKAPAWKPVPDHHSETVIPKQGSKVTPITEGKKHG